MTRAAAGAPPMVHPCDDVLAIIDDDDERADAAIEGLRAASFRDAEIHVFRGRKEIGGLARGWWRHSGVPAFLAPLLASVLSDERDVEEIYESEGLAGHTVLAVHTRTAEDVERARRVLSASGAHDTWYFWRWAMAPLDPTARHARQQIDEVMTMTIDEKVHPEAPAQGTVAHDLARLLADSYTLYLKTQGYHWNVTGPHFRSLHLLFEEQYTELAGAIDEIAERIRTLGPLAPGSYREMGVLSSVSDEEGAPGATEMVRRLIAANEVVVRTARAVVDAAEQADDPASLDLATRRIAVHEKTLWMLRATLEEERQS